MLQVTRHYAGMYTITNGYRTVRVYRNDEARKGDRWWITAEWLFGPERVIDAVGTYSEAKECAEHVLAGELKAKELDMARERNDMCAPHGA